MQRSEKEFDQVVSVVQPLPGLMEGSKTKSRKRIRLFAEGGEAPWSSSVSKRDWFS